MPSINKYRINSQQIKNDSPINVPDYVLPSKSRASIITAFYLLANLFFLIIFLTNLPVFKDSINAPAVLQLINFFSTYYQHFLIICITILVWDSIAIQNTFSKSKFPSIITLSAVLYNDIICVIFSVIVYYLDLRNIYFTYQIIFVIPIITIFLSSVFLIDDCLDLLKGKYVVIEGFEKKSKKKKKNSSTKVKGELKPTEPPMTILDETAGTEEHNMIAANAALLAIPFLNNTDKSNKKNEIKKPEINQDPKDNDEVLQTSI